MSEDIGEVLKIMAAKRVIKQRPFSAELNLGDIIDKIWEIQGACEDVRWADDQLEDILGEELATNFRMQYGDLAGSCDEFVEELQEYRDTWTLEGEERGDSYFDALVASGGGADDLAVYGSEICEGDYTPLWGWTEEYHRKTAEARVKALTKDKIIELTGDVLWLLRNYWDITHRYYLLAGVFELVQYEACHELDTVKEIEKAWIAWNEQRSAGAEADLNRQTAQLPDNVWLY